MAYKRELLTVRIDKKLKDELVAICEKHDTGYAEVIREFINKYIERHNETSNEN